MKKNKKNLYILLFIIGLCIFVIAGFLVFTKNEKIGNVQEMYAPITEPPAQNVVPSNENNF